MEIYCELVRIDDLILMYFDLLGSNSYAHHQTTVTTTNKSDLTGTTALPLNGFMNSSTFNEMEER